jgi:hypothetical protein
MTAITSEQTKEQTELVRERFRMHGALHDPLSYNEARLVIATMAYGGELHADWFLMINSSIQLFELEGLVSR